MTTIDVAGFRRDGWLLVRGVLDRSELDSDRRRGRPSSNDGRRWWPRSAPLRADRRRRGDRPQRGLRERRATSCATSSASGVVMRVLPELFDDRPCCSRRRSTTSSPAAAASLRTRMLPPTGSSTTTSRAWCRSTRQPRRAVVCRWRRVTSRAGCRPTSAAASSESTAARLELAARPGRAGRPAVLRFVHTALQRDQHHQPAAPRLRTSPTTLRRSATSVSSYYADKRRRVRPSAGGDFDGERVRISISDDFLGRPVRADRHA